MQQPTVLTIAGSDPSGGAGIQADLKTFSAMGCYGMAALTALTVQNTRGVFGVHAVPPAFVADQAARVLDDIGADAVKTGMLFDAQVVAAVADVLAAHRVERLVVDPVMVATSGDLLLREDARAALVERLLPMALVVTPNVPEAEVLAGCRIRNEDDMREAGVRIHALGPRHVLMKGGHLSGPEAIDLLYDGQAWHTLRAPRIGTPCTHGTGCTYAAALAAGLAHGQSVPEAAARAKEYLTGALEHAMPRGRGHGPVNHLWRDALQ